MPLNSYISLYEEGEDGVGTAGSADSRYDSSRMSTIIRRCFTLGERIYRSIYRDVKRAALSPLEDHVLYLHLLGTDYKTIAELLGKSPKTIDNALQRVKAKAEKVFAKKD